MIAKFNMQVTTNPDESAGNIPTGSIIPDSA